MNARSRGVIAAGHPVTAEAGARVLREGGNAVDAAVAAMLASWAAEPLLTGPGAGGYMLVAGAGEEPVLLDFFVAAPGFGGGERERAPLVPVDVSFGDAIQVFNVGAASCGTYGTPAGVCAALDRWGTVPLAELAAPAARLAREGVPLNGRQAYIVEILEGILRLTPESEALFAPAGTLLVEGDLLAQPDLADTIELLGREGAAPFYTGAVAEAVAGWIEAGGGVITRADLAAYEAIEREPVAVSYRGRRVLTNPPPNAGGILLAYALALLDRAPSPPPLDAVLEAMRGAQAERTPEFTAGLADEGFLERFVSSRLGATTHISVLDADGRACAVTCTNGEGSGVVVPGTGIHVNNIMGEEDLSPLGFHQDPPGRRMPSMMAPTVVLREGAVELVLGSAGSNRIRSALLQTIVNVVDRGMRVQEAVDAPRVHFEGDVVYAEPGVDEAVLARERDEVVRFRSPNLFFGGVQAVHRAAGEPAEGAGDPRRGGVALIATLSLIAALTLLSGCGVSSYDLFAVRRSGSIPGAKLQMVVSDGGTVSCNGGARRKIADDDLLQARALERALRTAALAHASRPPGPNSILRYDVSTADGDVAFSDTSRAQRPAYYRLALFVRRLAQRPCGLQR